VRASRAGPAYLSLQDVAEGPSSLPVVIRLEEPRAFDGLIVDGRDRRASGAIVTLFRLIDPPRPPGDASKEKPRRVLAGETIADGEGLFHIDDVGDAHYELLVWHPQLGKASLLLPREAGRLTIRLETPGIVRGRVIVAGKPRGGVDVISVPSPEAFSSADDLVDVKGGDARTGDDGRFAVMAAVNGGGELRVGGGILPVRRIPLPRLPAPLLELGDIDLGSPIEIAVVLDEDSPCDVRATGPIGQSGLQIVTATRTGPGLYSMVVPEPGTWTFGLLCGRVERSLAPALVRLSPATNGKAVRLSIR
jgi:hypothetical protein